MAMFIKGRYIFCDEYDNTVTNLEHLTMEGKFEVHPHGSVKDLVTGKEYFSYNQWITALTEPQSDPRVEGESWDSSEDEEQMDRDTPLVRAVKAKMNEEIERQQQKDMANDNIDPVTGLKKNKKDAVGATKAPTSCIPSAGIFAMGAAMQDGGNKYDPFNYRESQVTASVFFNAMMRHLLDWWEGQDFADDSKVHHLGHLMAGAAIVLDSISNENFIDDRPKTKIIAASRRTHVWKQV